MTSETLTYKQAFTAAAGLFITGQSTYKPGPETTPADLEAVFAPTRNITVLPKTGPEDDLTLDHRTTYPDGTVYGPVTLDGMTPVQGYYHPAVRWNGWLCPSFDRAAAEEVAEWINFDSADGPDPVCWWEGDVLAIRNISYPDEEPERYEPDAESRYAIGAFWWCWWAADEDD